MSDLIDRQALLKQIDIDSDGEPGYYGDTWKFIDTIKNMPNVHDLPKDTDTISRQAAIDALKNDMASLDHIIKGMSANDVRLDAYVSQRNQVNYDIYAIEQLPPAQPEQLEQCPIYGGMCAYPSDQCYDCPRHAGAKMESEVAE